MICNDPKCNGRLLAKLSASSSYFHVEGEGIEPSVFYQCSRCLLCRYDLPATFVQIAQCLLDENLLKPLPEKVSVIDN